MAGARLPFGTSYVFPTAMSQPLTDPSVEADFAGAASAATQLGLAAITGGLSLLAGGLLADSVPANPCQAALGGGTSAASKPPQSKPSALDEMVGNLKRLFQR